MRKRKKKSLAVLLFFFGVLLGYAGSMILPVQPVPEAQPLPSEAQPLREEDVRQQHSAPVEYGQGKPIFLGYLGIYGGRIAVFHGEPPHGTLQYVTDFEVREDLREQLAAGVPFRNANELLALLENYTS